MEPKIEIEYENFSKTFFPGDIVEGRVLVISNDSDFTVTEITIRMEGKRIAAVDPDKPEEFYFCENQITLLDEETDFPSEEMFEFPFEFKLGSKLPSTFRVSRASVEYQLVVNLKRKSDFDLSSKSPFYLTGLLLLDKGDESCVEIRQSKHVGCLSCFNFRGGHKFGISGKIYKNQFLPGENIEFSVTIWNCSKSTLEDLEISLIRELRVLDSGNFHTVLKEFGQLGIIYGPVITPSGKRTWASSDPDRNYLLRIPEETPPTHLGSKKLIELNYFFKISISPSGFCSSKLQCKFPIVIGSGYN